MIDSSLGHCLLISRINMRLSNVSVLNLRTMSLNVSAISSVWITPLSIISDCQMCPVIKASSTVFSMAYHPAINPWVMRMYNGILIEEPLFVILYVFYIDFLGFVEAAITMCLQGPFLLVIL